MHAASRTLDLHCPIPFTNPTFEPLCAQIVAKLGVDDFIIASIELYLDMINLFLYILRFLAASRR